ncbi:MAG: single-stranded DNA-binding protein [Blautia sp.]|nr:single-stranded DNA-binding protein [Blautia sp.]
MKTEEKTESSLNSNQVVVHGRVVEQLTADSAMYGTGFQCMQLLVEGRGGRVDLLPVLLSDRLSDPEEDHTGEDMEIHGELRTYNYYRDGRRHMQMMVFAREMQLFLDDHAYSRNQIYLDGYLCKTPFYRRTPSGKEITEILLAVNRVYGRSDYIPCICWGRTARYADLLDVGTQVRLWGRIQSREYQKKEPGAAARRYMTYEVSVARLEDVKEPSIAFLPDLR